MTREGGTWQWRLLRGDGLDAYGTGGRGLNELSGTAWVVFFKTIFKMRERVQAESRLLGLRAAGRVTLIDLQTTPSSTAFTQPWPAKRTPARRSCGS